MTAPDERSWRWQSLAAAAAAAASDRCRIAIIYGASYYTNRLAIRPRTSLPSRWIYPNIKRNILSLSLSLSRLCILVVSASRFKPPSDKNRGKSCSWPKISRRQLFNTLSLSISLSRSQALRMIAGFDNENWYHLHDRWYRSVLLFLFLFFVCQILHSIAYIAPILKDKTRNQGYLVSIMSHSLILPPTPPSILHPSIPLLE